MIAPIHKEPEKAFKRFKAYVDMGGKRGLRKLAKQLGLAVETLRDNSCHYKWQARLKAHMVAEAHDYNDAEQQAKLETARKNQAFRLKVLEQEQRTYDMIMSRLIELQEFPVYRVKIKKDWAKNDDGSFVEDKKGKRVPVTILMQPLAHSVTDVAKLAQAASMLGRMNQGMPTSRQEVSGADGAPLVPAIQPVVNVIIKRDKQSEQLKENERDFLEKHPDFLNTRKSRR